MNYKWKIADGYPAKNGYKVFSCFACGGGSTMGYKNAGFEVLGCNEIDPNIAEIYKLNHNPKYVFVDKIQNFCQREEYPKDLYELDVLDGSPPCSSFSMAGARGRLWGVEKKFREGQQDQVLDTLFFDFIHLADVLKPKVVISENVVGMTAGEAKEYFFRVIEEFDKAGYETQHWILDASQMGLPQKRRRLFFVSVRKDLIEKHFNGWFPAIDMNFYSRIISFEEATKEFWTLPRTKMNGTGERFWAKCEEGKSFASIPEAEKSYFNWIRLARNKPAPTLTATFEMFHHPILPGLLNEMEFKTIGSYPLDYQMTGKEDVRYLVGMSVPPMMMYNVASRVKEYVLDLIK